MTLNRYLRQASPEQSRAAASPSCSLQWGPCFRERSGPPPPAGAAPARRPLRRPPSPRALKACAPRAPDSWGTRFPRALPSIISFGSLQAERNPSLGFLPTASAEPFSNSHLRGSPGCFPRFLLPAQTRLGCTAAASDLEVRPGNFRARCQRGSAWGKGVSRAQVPRLPSWAFLGFRFPEFFRSPSSRCSRLFLSASGI